MLRCGFNDPAGSWKTTCAVATVPGLMLGALPATLTRPLVGCSNPATSLVKVDLPDPLSPITASVSPAFSVRLTPSRARTT